MAEPVLPAGFKVIEDSVPEGFTLEPSLLDKGKNVLRNLDQTLRGVGEAVVDTTAGIVGTVAGAGTGLATLALTGGDVEAARAVQEGVTKQLVDPFQPTTEFGQHLMTPPKKGDNDLSVKNFLLQFGDPRNWLVAPGETGKEIVRLPLESVKASEVVRYPAEIVGEFVGYPVAGSAVKGLVRKYLPEAVKKVSNERLLRDRSKLEVKENIETSVKAREARSTAQEYNKQRTSAEMENFAEEKLGQLKPAEESTTIINVEQPVSEFTPKESTNLQSQAVDIIGQLKDTLPTWEVDRLNELSQKSSFDWTPEDRLFLKEKQGQIKDLPVEEVAGRAAEPSVPEGFSLVDEFGRKIDSSSSMFREPERSKIDEVAEKGVEQSGKVQDGIEAEVGGETYTLDPIEPVRIPTRGYMPRGEAGAVLAGGAKPGFYSKVEDLVTFKMSGKMDAEQLRKMLKNNGATDAEIQSTLGELKGSVTKQQVLDEIAANKTELKDAVLVEGKPTDYMFDPQTGQLGNHAKFSQYVEPGAVPGSYRELFVTAPSKDTKSLKFNPDEFSPNDLERLNKWTKQYIVKDWQDGHSAYSNIPNPVVRIRFNERIVGGRRPEISKYVRDAKFQEIEDYYYKQYRAEGNDPVVSRTYATVAAEKDIKVWEEVEAESLQPVGGKRILFVEEVQPPSKANMEKMPEALAKRAYDIGVKRVLAYAKENGFDGVAWTTGKMQADRYSLSKHLDSLTVIKDGDEFRVGGFKNGRLVIEKRAGNVNELTELVGKDISSKAVNDLDYIGETKASDIYRDSILAEDIYDPMTGKLIAKMGDKFTDKIARQVYDAQIEKVAFLGKNDLMEFNKESLFSGGDRVSYSGVDLKIGGEGLKDVYDSRLPKLFEKYGKERVEEIKVSFPSLNEVSYVGPELSDIQLRALRDKYPRDSWESSVIQRVLDKVRSGIPFEDAIKRTALTDKDAEILGGKYEHRITTNNVSYTPISSKTPSSYSIYMGVNPLDLPNVVKGLRKNARELWEEHKALAAKDRGGRPGIAGDTVQAFREFFKEPERVLNKEEAGKKIFKELATAEENVNAFIYRNFKEYEKATRGIKKGSKEAEQIGKALDGQISKDQLTQNEQKAYDFLKQNFESMIVEYARRAAGSEEAYRRVVQLVGSKIEKQTKVKDLSPELRAEYDDLYKQAKELRGDKKVSELTGDDKVKYEDLRQEMRDLLSRDFRKKLPEGEAEAYDILSRKIKDYLPHMFEKEDLIAMFIDDIARSKKILETATNKGLITRTKNRIAELEKAVTKMQGGGLVTFNQLPSEIFFRFFQPRKGKQGYSFDALQAYETYLFGIARKMFDEPALKKISQEHFNNLSPELKPYAQEFVDHYFGYDRYKGNKLASAITSLEWMRTLGLNPRSAIVNLTQRLNTLAWVGEKYAVTAEKMMLEDLALKIKDKTTDKEREYTSDKIFEESGIAREVPNVLTEGPMPKGMEALRFIVGFMFNKIELGNRKHAYLSGYLKGLDLGKTKNLTGDALEAFAKKEAMKVVHKTQFRYGKLGMPKAMWNPVGRVALQFSSYPIKQLGFIADMWRKDPKTFLKWFAYAEGINYTMQELFDTDLSNALGVGISFGEALNVVSSLAEGDTKAAYRHLRQTVKPGSGLLPSGPGPMVSGALKVASAAGEGKGGEQLVKELTPIMYTRGKQAVQAIEGEQGGEYPILDDKGHPMYRLSARQLAQRTLGPKTAKEGKEQKKWTEERLLEQERRESLSTVVKAYLSGDKDAFRKAVMDNKEAVMAELKTPGSLQRLIENEIDRRNKTRGEREKPTSTKNIFELFRTGDVIQ